MLQGCAVEALQDLRWPWDGFRLQGKRPESGTSEHGHTHRTHHSSQLLKRILQHVATDGTEANIDQRLYSWFCFSFFLFFCPTTSYFWSVLSNSWYRTAPEVELIGHGQGKLWVPQRHAVFFFRKTCSQKSVVVLGVEYFYFF